MPLPGFLCIGAQKAGTTWLHEQIRTHPEIWMPPIKELQYFSHLFVPQHRKWTKQHIRRGASRELRKAVSDVGNINFSHVQYLTEIVTRDLFTESWYRSIYDRPAAYNRMSGDITPEYSTIPEQGIRYVRALLGQVKIIYLIRDPADRALSQMRMNVSRHHSSGKLSSEKWLNISEDWNIMNRGDYASYIKRWKAHFAPEDILFMPYGRIKSDPLGVLREVETFLGLSAHDYPRLNDKIHVSKKVDIPKFVKEKVTLQMQPQREFLETEFGVDFAKLT